MVARDRTEHQQMSDRRGPWLRNLGATIAARVASQLPEPAVLGEALQRALAVAAGVATGDAGLGTSKECASAADSGGGDSLYVNAEGMMLVDGAGDMDGGDLTAEAEGSNLWLQEDAVEAACLLLKVRQPLSPLCVAPVHSCDRKSRGSSVAMATIAVCLNVLSSRNQSSTQRL
jgi:hypothetical protein